MTAPAFERVGDADLAPGALRRVELADGSKVCIANADGSYFAVCDTCSHAGFSLAEGELTGTTLLCIWHGAQYDVRSGAVLRGPAAASLERFEVKADAGALWVRRAGVVA